MEYMEEEKDDKRTPEDEVGLICGRLPEKAQCEGGDDTRTGDPESGYYQEK